MSSRLEQLTSQLREEMIKQVAVGSQFDALIKLYEAAAMMNNAPLTEQYRQQLHDMLDLKLDTMNTVLRLTRDLVNTPPG